MVGILACTHMHTITYGGTPRNILCTCKPCPRRTCAVPSIATKVHFCFEVRTPVWPCMHWWHARSTRHAPGNAGGPGLGGYELLPPLVLHLVKARAVPTVGDGPKACITRARMGQPATSTPLRVRRHAGHTPRWRWPSWRASTPHSPSLSRTARPKISYCSNLRTQIRALSC